MNNGFEVLVCPCGGYQLETPRFWDPTEIEEILTEHLEDCRPLRGLLREAMKYHAVSQRVMTGVAAGGTLPPPQRGANSAIIYVDPPPPQVVIVEVPRRRGYW